MRPASPLVPQPIAEEDDPAVIDRAVEQVEQTPMFQCDIIGAGGLLTTGWVLVKSGCLVVAAAHPTVPERLLVVAERSLESLARIDSTQLVVQRSSEFVTAQSGLVAMPVHTGGVLGTQDASQGAKDKTQPQPVRAHATTLAFQREAEGSARWLRVNRAPHWSTMPRGGWIRKRKPDAWRAQLFGSPWKLRWMVVEPGRALYATSNEANALAKGFIELQPGDVLVEPDTSRKSPVPSVLAANQPPVSPCSFRLRTTNTNHIIAAPDKSMDPPGQSVLVQDQARMARQLASLISAGLCTACAGSPSLMVTVLLRRGQEHHSALQQAIVDGLRRANASAKLPEGIDPALAAASAASAAASDEALARLLQQQEQQATLAAGGVGSAARGGWEYIDDSDQKQGPFAEEMMRQWLLAGYFDGSTMVRCVSDVPGQPLGPGGRIMVPLQVLYPDPSRAFLGTLEWVPAYQQEAGFQNLVEVGTELGFAPHHVLSVVKRMRADRLPADGDLLVELLTQESAAALGGGGAAVPPGMSGAPGMAPAPPGIGADA